VMLKATENVQLSSRMNLMEWGVWQLAEVFDFGTGEKAEKRRDEMGRDLECHK
jgi:hypothetical protein